MTKLDEYFSGQYVQRLKALHSKVKLRTPIVGASSAATQEFAGWLQKELDFFYAGTQGHLKELTGGLPVKNKKHLLVISERFIHDYLLQKVSNEWLVKFITSEAKS